MTEKISDEKRNQIRQHWLEGKIIDEIHAITGVSTGRVSEEIKVYRRESKHDPLELRNTSIALAKMGTDPAEIKRMLNVYRQIEDAGGIGGFVGYSQIERIYKEKAPAAIQAGLRIISLESASGITYENLLSDYNEKAAFLSQFDVRVEGLRQQENELKKSLGDLRQFRALYDQLSKNKVSLDSLDNFLHLHEELARLHFTREAALILAAALQSTGLSPIEASREISRNLGDYPSLKASVEAIRSKEPALKSRIATYEKRIPELEARASGLEKQIHGLTQSFDQVKRDQAKELNLHRAQELSTLSRDLEKLRNSMQGLLQTLEEEIALAKKSLADEENRYHKLKTTIDLGLAVIRLIRGSASLSDDELNLLIRILNRGEEERKQGADHSTVGLEKLASAKKLLTEALVFDMLHSGVTPTIEYDKVVAESKTNREKLVSKEKELQDFALRVESGAKFLFPAKSGRTLCEVKCKACGDMIQLIQETIVKSLIEQGFFILKCKSGGCAYSEKMTASDILTKLEIRREHAIVGLA
jgi:hypothetical protein